MLLWCEEVKIDLRNYFIHHIDVNVQMEGPKVEIYWTLWST